GWPRPDKCTEKAVAVADEHPVFDHFRDDGLLPTGRCRTRVVRVRDPHPPTRSVARPPPAAIIGALGPAVCYGFTTPESYGAPPGLTRIAAGMPRRLSSPHGPPASPARGGPPARRRRAVQPARAGIRHRCGGR